MTTANDVSFNKDINWLTSGGTIRLNACGKIMYQSVCIYDNPEARPASICPFSIDNKPAANNL